MATFDPSVPSIQPDGNLSRFSQGTEPLRMQPLAEVPKLSEKYVQPDYKANTAAGKGLTDLGEDLKSDVGLVANVIKQKADDVLSAGIDKIRDGFGVAQVAADADALGPAIGAAGTESLAGDQTQTPQEVKKLGARVDSLNEAYQQGNLSNTAFYGKLEAFVRQTKQQFPGFSDDIDSMVSTKVGTTPANALRTAIQSDVTELQKKVQAQNDKWTTYENTNTQYIHTQWPNYEADKANGKGPSHEEVKATVGTLQARDYATDSGIKRLAASKAIGAASEDKATEITSTRLSDIAGHLSVGVANTLGIKDMGDFQKLLDDVRNGKRPPLTPEEKTAASGVFATLEQRYNVEAQKFVNQNTDKDGLPMRPVASYFQTPGKLAQLITQGRAAIDDLKAGVFDQQYGVMVQSQQWNKAMLDAGETDFIRRTTGPFGVSVAATAAAGRKFFGDDGALMLSLGTPYIKNQALDPYRQYNQGAIANGGSSLKEVFDDLKRENINDGGLNSAIVGDTIKTIFHPEKTSDPELAGKNAVQHAFGPGNRTLIDGMGPNDAVTTFTTMAQPLMTKKIMHMDSKSQDTYFGWVNDSFASIYEGEAKNINLVAKNLSGQGGEGNVKLKFNPETTQFEFKAGTAYQATGLANRTVLNLNAGLQTMKEVWKAEGKDATQELHRLLPTVGVEPGSPIYKTVQEEMDKQTKSEDQPSTRGDKR